MNQTIIFSNKKLTLSIDDVNKVRDSATLLENSNPQLSLDLFLIALKFRPHGNLLKKKVSKLIKEVVPSEDLTNSLVDSLYYLPGGEYKAISRIVKENLNKIEGISTAKEMEGEIISLKQQIKLLKNKYKNLHEALCYSEAFNVKVIDDPAAKMYPIEVIDRGHINTLIVFGGMATRPSMPPKEFFSSFQDKPVNMIFIKDFKQCWYQNGLTGLSHDLESTVEYIKKKIPIETENITSIGMSSGGYAAIIIGLKLFSNKILAFSPQTKIDKKTFLKFKGFDSEKSDIKFGDESLNLFNFLSNFPHHNREISLYYGETNYYDSESAMLLKEFCSLYPQKTSDHNVAAYLKSEGLLNEVLERSITYK